MSARPLLTLCMIVKDEAHGIARTLQSAKPWIDRWCILDTGSTDGTPEIVRAKLEGVDGVMIEGAFVDFATMRNKLLDLSVHLLAGGGFLLLLDADDVLEGGEALRSWLEVETCLRPTEEREAFYVRMNEGACEWSSARIVRASAVGMDGWHYVGAVHEVLVHPSGRVPTITIPGVSIRHECAGKSMAARVSRWERDVEALRKEIATDPKNARAVFYLGQTLMKLGRLPEAIDAFKQRLALAGFWQERYMSALEIGRLLLPDAERFVWWMLEAHAIDPRRAEPLYELADFYRKRPGGSAMGPMFTFARAAFERARPAGGLFIDGEIYAWKAADLVASCAFYLGEFETGERAARQALEAGPEAERERLARNLHCYEERKAR